MKPFVVDVTRGSTVESQHFVDAIAFDKAGKILIEAGDCQRPVFPRSAIKPIQALLMMESGAVEKYGLDDQHISLACASHRGRVEHTNLVRDWLQKMGLSEQILACGAHAPMDRETSEAMIRSSASFSKLHNNCSGKHCGILAAALKLGYDADHYDRYDHPVQRKMREVLSQLSGDDLAKAAWGVDGCGIPSYSQPLMSLGKMSSAFMRNVNSMRILKAMARHPDLFSGPGSFGTEIAKGSEGHAIAKTGAEGVYAAFLPERGISFVVKVRDGAQRASEFVTAHLLKKLGGISEAQFQKLSEFTQPVVKNWAGKPVGEIKLSES